MTIVMMHPEQRLRLLANIAPRYIGYSKEADFTIHGCAMNLVPIRQMPMDTLVVYYGEEAEICLRFKLREAGLPIEEIMPWVLYVIGQAIEDNRPRRLENKAFEAVVLMS